MFTTSTRLFSRLLVLILTISSFQSGYAINLDQNSLESHCQTLQLNPDTITAFENELPCNTEHKTHCFNFLGCTSSLNGSSILSRNSYQEPARVIIKIGYEKIDPTLFTIYSKLFKRPPIAYSSWLPG